MTLPNNYDILKIIDLKNNQRDNIIVTAINVLFMIVLFVAGYFTKGLAMFVYFHYKYAIFNVLIALFGTIAYIFLHELTHALFIKIFEPKCKVKIGFNIQMAYTKADTYFKKIPYSIITLAPLIIWTLVLLVPCLTVPIIYFWGVYFIQIINVAGAAGDFYVAFSILPLPKNILIYDTGTAMEIYALDELSELKKFNQNENKESDIDKEQIENKQNQKENDENIIQFDNSQSEIENKKIDLPNNDE